jgi:hypothetical protein
MAKEFSEKPGSMIDRLPFEMPKKKKGKEKLLPEIM